MPRTSTSRSSLRIWLRSRLITVSPMRRFPQYVQTLAVRHTPCVHLSGPAQIRLTPVPQHTQPSESRHISPSSSVPLVRRSGSCMETLVHAREGQKQSRVPPTMQLLQVATAVSQPDLASPAGVLEGIALVGDPEFALVDEAFPYISKRLMTDDSPRLQAALRYMVSTGMEEAGVVGHPTMRLQNLCLACSSCQTCLPIPPWPGYLLVGVRQHGLLFGREAHRSSGCL